jgi:hypothetical protein
MAALFAIIVAYLAVIALVFALHSAICAAASALRRAFSSQGAPLDWRLRLVVALVGCLFLLPLALPFLLAPSS